MHPDLVYHVQHIALLDGAYFSAVTDLIFVEKQPVAVLTWGGKPGKEYPLVSAPLDPARLQEFRNGYVTHLYDGVLECPAPAPGAPQPAPHSNQ
jgi:hypothetical protein